MDTLKTVVTSQSWIFLGWVTWPDLVTWPEMTLGKKSPGNMRNWCLNNCAQNDDAAAIREKPGGVVKMTPTATRAKVAEIVSNFRKISHSAKFDLWWPLVTSILTWAKNNWNTLECAHCKQLKDFFCVFLSPLVFELGAVVIFTPPPPSLPGRRWLRWSPERRL